MPIILGYDALLDMDAKICLSENRIYFANNTVFLNLTTKYLKTSVAFLRCNVVMQPFSERQVSLRLVSPWCRGKERNLAFLEKLPEVDQVAVAKSLVCPAGGNLIAKIFNPFPHQITLKRGTNLAEVSEIDASDIFTLRTRLKS